METNKLIGIALALIGISLLISVYQEYAMQKRMYQVEQTLKIEKTDG